MEHGQGIRCKERRVTLVVRPGGAARAWRQGKIYVGTFDGRLVALDARTGRQIWSVMTVDPDKPYTITQAPRVIMGRVVIGNSGAEYGVRGYISAYDAEKGTLAWRFYTVPGDPASPPEQPILAEAAKTWHGEWWKAGGGGTVWESLSYDPEFNLIYFGVSNGLEPGHRLTAIDWSLAIPVTNAFFPLSSASDERTIMPLRPQFGLWPVHERYAACGLRSSAPHQSE